MGDWPWLLLPLLALPLGYGAGRFMRRSRVGLTFVMLLPLLIYTLALAMAEPAEPNFLSWWLAGLIVLSPPHLVWLILAIVGFTFGRRKVSDLP